MFSKRFGAFAALMLTILLAAPAAFAQAPEPWQLGLQAAASPVGHQVGAFHNLLLWIITGITLFVLALLVYVMVRFNANRNPNPDKTTHHTLIEVVWTVVPVLILVVIAIPSFRLLYFMEKAENPEMTVKVTGYQWYWGYEYPDQGGVSFTSNMIPDAELKPGQKRLLEVDNRMVVPVNTVVRLQTTAADVIHAFALPAFGVKKDAIPGRLNETWFKAEREGVYYGQCSEICGINHGYMPIAIEVVSKPVFEAWVKRAQAGNVLSPAMAAADPADGRTQTAQAGN
ncbi:MAG TPA: cytochrome c oxidase subunit II [Azospirillaceae bacterium]|nr:cytochrome c oxidase subunit II [Azospirillaceae bacterium]